MTQYRAGEWKEAIASLQKCRDLRTDDAEWSNPFFLAMAHWRLGEKEAAWRFYDQAVTRMEDNRPTYDDRFRFRAEAAALMKEEPGKKPDRP